MKIAILGWGSLIWDNQLKFENFNNKVGRWHNDGPELKLEFSRISGSRGNALTLVIDKNNGEPCQVQFAMSKRKCPDDAICDLRSREGTILNRIGYYYTDGSKTRKPDAPESIKNWANEKEIDVVVWTGLESNFKKVSDVDFTVDAAVEHLKQLPNGSVTKAAEYIRKAPECINTPLRRILQNEQWFTDIYTDV
jgi:hypothetical protein